MPTRYSYTESIFAIPLAIQETVGSVNPMKRELAGPDEIRQWAYKRHWTDRYGRKVADVGRLPSKLVRDFEKATGKQYMVAYEPRPEPEPQDDNDVVEIVAVLRVPRRYLHS